MSTSSTPTTERLLKQNLADLLRTEPDELLSALERLVYETVLLDTLVHELNTIRGVLGEPDRLDYVSLHKDTVTVMLPEEISQKTVGVYLLDATTGAELTAPLTVDVAISM